MTVDKPMIAARLLAEMTTPSTFANTNLTSKNEGWRLNYRAGFPGRSLVAQPAWHDFSQVSAEFDPQRVIHLAMARVPAPNECAAQRASAKATH